MLAGACETPVVAAFARERDRSLERRARPLRIALDRVLECGSEIRGVRIEQRERARLARGQQLGTLSLGELHEEIGMAAAQGLEFAGGVDPVARVLADRLEQRESSRPRLL